MRYFASSGAIAAVVVGLWGGSQCPGQTINPDFRIRAEFRTVDNGQWPGDVSAGHAEFRVVSRFGQLYYGGVVRQDEFRFDVYIDLTEADDFASEFPGSPFNTSYDVYIDDDFVGRAVQNVETYGVAQFGHDSRHPTPPRTALPLNFPSPVAAGAVVRVYFAGATLPAIGDPRPAGEAVLTSAFVEPFARGDVNTDGEVDDEDFLLFAPHYDPSGLHGLHVGPALGDFTGDNASNFADYEVMVMNWTGDNPPPAAPVACISSVDQPDSLTTCRTEAASFTMGVTRSGALSY